MCVAFLRVYLSHIPQTTCLKFWTGAFRKDSALILHIVKCEFRIADPRYVRQKNATNKMCNIQNNSFSQYAVWISNH